MAGTLSRGLAAIGRWLLKEFIALWPVFLFLFFGFVFLITLVKLALAQFSVETMVLSNALIGALLGAKAALVLDETPLARSLEKRRGIVAIAAKVAFYGGATLLLGYVERLVEAVHKVHSFSGAIGYVMAHASHYRLLAWALGISFIFGLYFSFVEINARMGEGELRKLFFESRMTADGSRRPSGIKTARGQN